MSRVSSIFVGGSDGACTIGWCRSATAAANIDRLSRWRQAVVLGDRSCLIRDSLVRSTWIIGSVSPQVNAGACSCDVLLLRLRRSAPDQRPPPKD